MSKVQKKVKKKVVIKKKKIEIKELPLDKKEVKAIEEIPQFENVRLFSEGSKEKPISLEKGLSASPIVGRRKREDSVSSFNYLIEGKEGELYSSTQEVNSRLSRLDRRATFLDNSPKTISGNVGLNEIDLSQSYLERDYAPKTEFKRASDKDTFLDNPDQRENAPDNPYKIRKF